MTSAGYFEDLATASGLDFAAAGALIGLGIAMKVTPIIFVVYFAWKRRLVRRTIVWLAAAALRHYLVQQHGLRSVDAAIEAAATTFIAQYDEGILGAEPAEG